MANLIITVISIALVAVAALMGAYYGGQAFMDGQAKAQANQLIEGSKQVAAAWQLYANENNESFTLVDANWLDGTATDLVPKYLSAIPRFEFANLLPSNAYYPSPILISGNSFSQSSQLSNNIQVIGIPQKVCEQVNFLATGVAFSGSSNWGGWSNTATAMNDLKPFFCARYSSYFNFLYRVF